MHSHTQMVRGIIIITIEGNLPSDDGKHASSNTSSQITDEPWDDDDVVETALAISVVAAAEDILLHILVVVIMGTFLRLH